MAQTTGGMSAQDMYVGWSTDNATWVEVTGSCNSIEVAGGERQMGEAWTFQTTTPIVKAGNKSALTVTVRGLYSADADEIYAKLKAGYEATTAVYLRWSPGGGDSGDLGYTTGPGYVITPPYPYGNAEDGNPILVVGEIQCTTITQSTLGTDGW